MHYKKIADFLISAVLASGAHAAGIEHKQASPTAVIARSAAMPVGSKMFFGTLDQPNLPTRSTAQVAALGRP
jgi:hypothetical protein